ncbi:MAG: hypothetical protein IAE79_21160 [Anaerolinea sp.]|nr:hypothetical protein [Anaerolinea sp.]
MIEDDIFRWSVFDHYGNEIYLTQERWQHIIDPINHPEMDDFEEQLRETIRNGRRQQDALNPRKYRYTKAFAGLVDDNTHVVSIVLFGYGVGVSGEPLPKIYIVTAYQKEIW